MEAEAEARTVAPSAEPPKRPLGRAAAMVGWEGPLLAGSLAAGQGGELPAAAVSVHTGPSAEEAFAVLGRAAHLLDSGPQARNDSILGSLQPNR